MNFKTNESEYNEVDEMEATISLEGNDKEIAESSVDANELVKYEAVEPTVEVIEDNPNINTGAANDFLSNNVNMELLGKIQNLTNAFSETVVPMQEQNNEMKQYIDEANAYIDSLEEQIKKLEKENKELKSRLQDQ